MGAHFIPNFKYFCVTAEAPDGEVFDYWMIARTREDVMKALSFKHFNILSVESGIPPQGARIHDAV